MGRDKDLDGSFLGRCRTPSRMDGLQIVVRSTRYSHSRNFGRGLSSPSFRAVTRMIQLGSAGSTTVTADKLQDEGGEPEVLSHMFWTLVVNKAK